MLRNVNPLLSPDILHMLSSMGHGHEVVIADANFPGIDSGPRCVRADGVSASDMLKAVLSVTPLDQYADERAFCMETVEDASIIPDAVAEFQAIIRNEAENAAPITGVERFAFYERAEEAFGVILTGELRLYGNIILKKGVIL